MDHWRELRTEFHKMRDVTSVWTPRNFNLFFEIEALLYLAETLKADLDVQNVWVLVSGYVMEDINDSPEARQMCLRLRQRLRYVKTSNAWRVWLKWYRDQPESIRLYGVTPDNRLQHRTYEGILREDRLRTYRTLFSSDVENPDRILPYAEPDKEYRFYTDGIVQSVEIPPTFLQFTQVDTPHLVINKRTDRNMILIDLDILLDTAQEIDVLESNLNHEQGNWYQRMSRLDFAVRSIDNSFLSSRNLALDGLLHLAGALGAGKSTLIRVLTYYLTKYEGKHVTVVMNTVVEAMNFAVWLQLLGIHAAPALGLNRGDHALKYGLANEDRLTVGNIFKPEAPHEPILEWMPVPCAISGMVTIPVPVGEEPCRSLENVTGIPQRHRCPLIPVCPVHNLPRALVDAQVWVLNPMSFLYSSAPEGIGNQRMMLFEAVYRRSDLVIIDEADRVQVQWDRAFTPNQAIAGSDNALLDSLRRKLSAAATGVGRQNARTTAFNHLTNLDDQTNILTNRAYRLMGKHPYLARWIKTRQITNSILFGDLTNRLIKSLSSTLDEDTRLKFKAELETIFKTYWEKPRQSRGGYLALWIRDLLGSDLRERELQKGLHHWLTELMGWGNLTLTPKQRQGVHRLDFATTLTAMMKQTNDIFHQLNWIEDEIGDLDNGAVELNEELLTLIPDSPLGEMLGLRLVTGSAPGGPNVFMAMRYRGVGRWLLHNFDHLYMDRDGVLGPHVLLTSATGWLPGSSQFHLAVQPEAVLTEMSTQVQEPKPQSTVHLEFRPIQRNQRWLRVSGTGQSRHENLKQLIRHLAKSGASTPSDLQMELNFWSKRGEKRSILLVVNSYDQSRMVLEELNTFPEWRDRVIRLIPDDASAPDDTTIRARRVERLHEYQSVDVLIVPLMAIQRGFNILDETGGALLGTVFFLVRPIPPPDDLSPQLLSLNAWWMRQLEDYSSRLKGNMQLNDLRRQAFRAWNKRLRSGNRGVSSIDADLYGEFLCDQFIPIWQTIGRLIRGGRDARVIFVDGAFGSQIGRRHMLRDWYDMLDRLVHTPDQTEQFVARLLYSNAYAAFREAFESGRIF